MRPASLLRIEGLALFVLATGAFFRGDWGWVMFVVLVLAPDLSMAGYLLSRRVGSATYNGVHTALLPAALLVVSWSVDWSLGSGLALIWAAHIGADRALGYGLKYSDAPFAETHLQRV